MSSNSCSDKCGCKSFHSESCSCKDCFGPFRENSSELCKCSSLRDKKRNNLRYCFRNLTLYSLDTCLLQYRPKAIFIPSKRFPDLGDALRCLLPYNGGYNIYLKPYCKFKLDSFYYLDVSNIRIYGDRSHVVGVSFINCPPHSVSVVGHYVYGNAFGRPPYQLSYSGNRIVVTGSIPPDFTGICPGRRVLFVTANGLIHENEVSEAAGNYISFVKGIPLSNPIVYGEGFLILPNVTIDVKPSRYMGIECLSNLRIQGVTWRSSSEFILGSHVQLILYFCVFWGPVSIRQKFFNNAPNTFLGTFSMDATVRGFGMFQGVISKEGRIIADQCSSTILMACTMASSKVPLSVQNGSHIDLFTSMFINCTVGCALVSSSHVDVQGTLFYGNRIAISCTYFSSFSSYHITNEEESTFFPVFRENYILANIAYSSSGITPNIIMEHNNITVILDSDIRTNAESVPLGSYGSNYSLFVILPNPLDPQASLVDASEALRDKLNRVYKSLAGPRVTGLLGTLAVSSPGTINNALDNKIEIPGTTLSPSGVLIPVRCQNNLSYMGCVDKVDS